jgi:hypothetical protein
MYNHKKEKEKKLSFLDDLSENIESSIIKDNEESESGDIVPVDLETFLYDKDYLGLPFRISKIQKQFMEAITDDFTDTSSTRYSELAILWGKGCLKNNSIIYSTLGEKFTIEQLIKEGKGLKSYGYNEETKKLQETNLSVPWCKGFEQLYKVEVEDGNYIEVTANHKFLTPSGWKRLIDITDKDEILNEHPSFVKIKSIIPTTVEEIYTLESYPTNNYFSNGILNHNSGKDFISGVACLWTVYRLLCYADPRKTLRDSSGGKISIAPGDYIDILNVAINAEQAKTVFLHKLLGLVKNAGPKAFKRFGFDLEKHVTVNSITFPKELRIISGHSQAQSMEGKNLLMAILDEISAFKVASELKGTKGQLSAEEMYDVLRTSINTRFPSFGKLIMISYPRHKKDFLMQYYEKAESLLEKNPNLGIFLSKASTWEVNTTKSKEDKAIKEDYEKNPEKAAQFYECIAPSSEDPFFKHKDKIHRMYETLEVMNPFNPSGGYSNDFRAKPYYYVIHLDLAYASDRASLGLSHVEGEAENRMYYCDLIKYWEAEPGKEVDLELIEKEIIFLRQRGFNIIDVSYDNASLSKYLIQRIEKQGFNTTYITVDRNIAPYNSLKDLIYSEKVLTYYNELLVEELLSLAIINGNKVDHLNSNGIGKDLADVFCGSIYNLLVRRISATKRYFRTF